MPEIDKEEPVIVMDTNVLLIDPAAYLKFDTSTIVIPLIVIEEIDSFKRETSPIGKAAREFIRFLDDLRKTGKLTEGVPLETGGKLVVKIVEQKDIRLPSGLDRKVKDNYILAAAMQFRDEGYIVSLVTKDADLRIKTDVIGIDAQDYTPATGNTDRLFTGERVLEVDPDIINRFYSKEPGAENPEWKELTSEEDPLLVNEYITLRAGNQSAIGRCHSDGTIHHIRERPAVGIQARNREQHFAMDALLDPGISMVTLAGMAGTGKTLLAIACGLEQVLDEKHYRKILIARPVVPLGRDLGALPGEIRDKLRPWMQPIYDNLEFILGPSGDSEEDEPSDKKEVSHKDRQSVTIQYLMQSGLLAVEPLTYIRGRSIPGQYIIIDEAQNLSPHEAKTIITRAGEGSKIVFTGDFFQIDHPYLNLYSNGISFTSERFKGQDIFAHVTLQKGERSKLAEMAHELLEI